MGSDGPAQMRMSAGLAVAHHVVTAAAPMLGRKTIPLRDRKRIERRQGRREGARYVRKSVTLAEALGGCREAPGQLWRLDVARGRPVLGRLWPIRAEHCTDERAGANAALDEAVRGQPIEHLDDRRARDTQLAGGGAGRRHSLTGRESTTQDHVAQRHIELCADRSPASALDLDGLQQRTSGTLDHTAMPYRSDILAEVVWQVI